MDRKRDVDGRVQPRGDRRQAISLLLLAILVSRTGDIILKYGLRQTGGVSFAGGQLIPSLLAAFTQPLVLLALTLAFGGALLWLGVLARSDLSWALPLLSLGYIYVALAGSIFLQEQVTSVQWLGIAIICLGVYLTARS